MGAPVFILTIDPGTIEGQGACHYLTILDDSAFEKNETFSIHISSEPRVNIAQKYLEITIQDDDSKFDFALGYICKKLMESLENDCVCL